MPNGYVLTKENRRRARAAAAAISAHGKKTGLTKADGKRTRLNDLLIDLMHWAAQGRVDFSDVMQNAAGYYISESKGKEF